METFFELIDSALAALPEVPDSREQSIVRTKLQEALMWAAQDATLGVHAPEARRFAGTPG